MAETLFGSGPQLWPTLPVPGFGYVQALSGNRIQAAPMTMNPSPPDPAQLMSSGWSAPVSPPVGSGLPAITTPEFTPGITPQALLTVVAARRGQPMGPTSDQEIEDFISDALDLLSGATDVDIRCENGRTTLTGSVPNKRVKRDVGEIVWAIPSVSDVHNNVAIAARRRSRGSGRDAEVASVTGASRKQT
jgi:BON domain-containing protein